MLKSIQSNAKINPAEYTVYTCNAKINSAKNQFIFMLKSIQLNIQSIHAMQKSIQLNDKNHISFGYASLSILGGVTCYETSLKFVKH